MGKALRWGDVHEQTTEVVAEIQDTYFFKLFELYQTVKTYNFIILQASEIDSNEGAQNIKHGEFHLTNIAVGSVWRFKHKPRQ